MAERLKAHAWKACVRESVPWVRIPLPPPVVLDLFLAFSYRPPMFDIRPFEPVSSEEIESALTEAIRSSAGGQMTRNIEVFLAGVCARHLSDHLALAGFIVMRRVDQRRAGARQHNDDIQSADGAHRPWPATAPPATTGA